MAGLREAGAWIIDRFCEEQSTLQALALPEDGEDGAEVARRVATFRRWLAVQVDGAGWELWPDEAPWTPPPEEAQILVHADGQPVWFVRWEAVAVELGCFSRHPAMRAFVQWLTGELMPALQRHGYYDPATGHAPPPSHLLDAIECRERGRDVMNRVAPGLGDWLAGSTGPDVIIGPAEGDEGD
jgi:hypothetical protein